MLKQSFLVENTLQIYNAPLDFYIIGSWLIKSHQQKAFLHSPPQKAQLPHVACVSTEQRNDTFSLLCHIYKLGWIIRDNISFIEIADAIFLLEML